MHNYRCKVWLLVWHFTLKLYFIFLNDRWSYSCLSLEMTLEIAKLMDLDNTNCNTTLSDSQVPRLSVQNEIDIAKCFQLVVGFGLLPNLIPNIGIPIQKRSKWHNLFSQSPDLTDEQVGINNKIPGNWVNTFEIVFLRNILG